MRPTTNDPSRARSQLFRTQTKAIKLAAATFHRQKVTMTDSSRTQHGSNPHVPVRVSWREVICRRFQEVRKWPGAQQPIRVTLRSIDAEGCAVGGFFQPFAWLRELQFDNFQDVDHPSLHTHHFRFRLSHERDGGRVRNDQPEKANLHGNAPP
ncbi:hypothetical protein M011DRAFT_460151 [Sporormia fimetaria CBS 119925]|uniref:Uncharacterized protein n=1 Tax=Sporormia fimetaria CBS 119925 TaxID=1340428 RepID=A0A6A6V411_9PLEO|nr:hypothetical protein M011DRAFT_460151 [Sporormia fimetaria CBS 119925]